MVIKIVPINDIEIINNKIIRNATEDYYSRLWFANNTAHW